MPGDMSKGGARAATPANQVYPACRDLFDGYPLAVSSVEHVPTMRSIVLMLHDGEGVRFFALLRDCGDGRPVYSVVPWDASGTVTIESGGADVPDPAAKAVLWGVPIPQDGSLFGWIDGAVVIALIVIYGGATSDRPEPSWSVMPLVGTPETQWPPFTGERLLGPWFWNHHRAGRIIDLSGVISATTDTVFWVETYPALGSDSCVVASDVKTPDGHLLRRGTYLDSAALQAAVPVPSLAELLGADNTDLAPRFQETADRGGWPQADEKAS